MRVDYIVVGAPGKTVGLNAEQGAVYYLKPTSPIAWQEQKLVAADGAAGDRLGASVATQNNYIVAGAPERTVKNKVHHGATYLFLNNAGVWKQEQKFIPGDGAAENYFGYSIGIGGPFVVIGTPGKDANKGGVYFAGF